MNTTQIKSIPIPPRLAVVAALAHLLQRLEGAPMQASAEQYRAVAQRLAHALADVPSDVALDALLAAHPAAAEVYENLNYQHAGLCRAPLEPALQAELRAQQLIAKAAAR